MIGHEWVNIMSNSNLWVSRSSKVQEKNLQNRGWEISLERRGEATHKENQHFLCNNGNSYEYTWDPRAKLICNETGSHSIACSWTPIEIISPLLIILVEVSLEVDLSKRISVQVVYLYMIPGSTGSRVGNWDREQKEANIGMFLSILLL